MIGELALNALRDLINFCQIFNCKNLFSSFRFQGTWITLQRRAFMFFKERRPDKQTVRREEQALHLVSLKSLPPHPTSLRMHFLDTFSFSDKNIKWAMNVGNVLFPSPEAEHISCKSWIATFHSSSQMNSPQKSKSSSFLRFGLLRQTNQKHPGNKALYILRSLLRPKPVSFASIVTIEMNGTPASKSIKAILHFSSTTGFQVNTTGLLNI